MQSNVTVILGIDSAFTFPTAVIYQECIWAFRPINKLIDSFGQKLTKSF